MSIDDQIGPQVAGDLQLANGKRHEAEDTHRPSSSPNAVREPSSPTHSTGTTATTGTGSTRGSRSWFNKSARPRTSPGPRASAFKARGYLQNDDARRDSALTQSTRASKCLGEEPIGEGIQAVNSLPTIVVQDEDGSGGETIQRQKSTLTENDDTQLNETRPSYDLESNNNNNNNNNSNGAEVVANSANHGTDDPTSPVSPISFHGITTSIPSASFEDLTQDQLTFSNRGSIFLGGKKARLLFGAESPASPASPSSPTMDTKMEALRKLEERNVTMPRMETLLKMEERQIKVPRSGIPPQRILSADEIMLSRKVRFMYEHGNEKAGAWALSPNASASEVNLSAVDEDAVSESCPSPNPDTQHLRVEKIRKVRSLDARSASLDSRRQSFNREPSELAGGVEDWEDVDGREVDRYGFINPRKLGSRDSITATPEPDVQIHRVSTALQLVSETPRRNRTLRRKVSVSKSTRSLGAPSRNSDRRSLRTPASVYSYAGSSRSTASQRFLRYASNKLPHNRDRRMIDEAGDMLRLPPGLADIAEQEDGGRVAAQMKKKEWQREDKWRKMGRKVSTNGKGGGMEFEFNTKDSKLIDRTWKGIPDRWRSPAWFCFLSRSAKNDKSGPTEEALIESFYELQDEASPDDMQIDVDVPRTISRHIMFRRRYRGGQRLLFRVLHAISLYLPETGYVQGMAAIAATLLCYYSEERAFVMLYWLYQYRGLAYLYQPGFSGLMDCLKDFEDNFLTRYPDIFSKLEEMNVSSTAYGTRWYLTLFNYSLPFPAQLRVWDVFMLLGDVSNISPPISTSSSKLHKSNPAHKDPTGPSEHKLDGAALASPTKPRHSTSTSNHPPPTYAYGADLDILHAAAMAIIDAERAVLMAPDSDFETVMKTLTSWVPVKDERLLIGAARGEWMARKGKRSWGLRGLV